MNIGGGEAADQLVRMLLSGGEVAVRLGGSAAKNLLAMSLALAKNHKKISGKVRMGKMLQQTRDLRVFPMTQEEYREFRLKAREPKLLYAAIQNSRDSNGPNSMVDVVMAGHRGGTGQFGVPEDDVPATGVPPKGAAVRERQRRWNRNAKKDSRSDAPHAIPAPALLRAPGARRGRRVRSGPLLRAACRAIALGWRNSVSVPRPGRKPRRGPRPDDRVLFGESAGYSGPVRVWLSCKKVEGGQIT